MTSLGEVAAEVLAAPDTADLAPADLAPIEEFLALEWPGADHNDEDITLARRLVTLGVRVAAASETERRFCCFDLFFTADCPELFRWLVQTYPDVHLIDSMMELEDGPEHLETILTCMRECDLLVAGYQEHFTNEWLDDYCDEELKNWLLAKQEELSANDVQ